MNYVPVVPKKTYLMTGAVPQVGPLFIFNPYSQEELDRIPRRGRVSVAASILAWQFLSEVTPEEHLRSLLGWPEGAPLDTQALFTEQRAVQLKESWDFLLKVWPYECHEARKHIYDEDTALLALVLFSGPQEAVDAFCPEGSKGFARFIGNPDGRVNNPRSIRPVRERRPDPTLVALFGRQMGRELSKFTEPLQPEQPEEEKDVIFPDHD